MLELHNVIILWSYYKIIAIKIFAVAKWPAAGQGLKSLNDRQSHVSLKFMESKEPIQFKLSYGD